MNAWLYHGGGIKLWEEVYAPFNLVPMPIGNTGVQMTGWFRKPIEKVEDFSGLKMRIPGLAGKVYATLGVDVRLLPGGEIFPALERGVIDAAEFVGPFQDRRLGLHKAAWPWGDQRLGSLQNLAVGLTALKRRNKQLGQHPLNGLEQLRHRGGLLQQRHQLGPLHRRGGSL
jgi:hypothetical protein